MYKYKDGKLTKTPTESKKEQSAIAKLDAKIAELEKTLAEKDAKIAELEKFVETLKDQMK